LSANKITRQEAFRVALIAAFVPFFVAAYRKSANRQDRIEKKERAWISSRGTWAGSKWWSGRCSSGKSEELIRRLRRGDCAATRADFQAAIDARYAANEIVSHSGLGITSDTVMKASEILEKIQPRTEVVGIDEAQFWEKKFWMSAPSWRILANA
jgi:hypothetical protein